MVVEKEVGVMVANVVFLVVSDVLNCSCFFLCLAWRYCHSLFLVVSFVCLLICCHYQCSLVGWFFAD